MTDEHVLRWKGFPAFLEQLIDVFHIFPFFLDVVKSSQVYFTFFILFYLWQQMSLSWSDQLRLHFSLETLLLLCYVVLYFNEIVFFGLRLFGVFFEKPLLKFYEKLCLFDRSWMLNLKFYLRWRLLLFFSLWGWTLFLKKKRFGQSIFSLERFLLYFFRYEICRLGFLMNIDS